MSDRPEWPSTACLHSAEMFGEMEMSHSPDRMHAYSVAAGGDREKAAGKITDAFWRLPGGFLAGQQSGSRAIAVFRSYLKFKAIVMQSGFDLTLNGFMNDVASRAASQDRIAMTVV